MSKIGAQSIRIPESILVSINDGIVEVKGAAGGVMTVPIPKGITVEKQDQNVLVKRDSDEKKVKSLHGLIRVLIHNAVLGVEKNWEKKLEVHGTGFRVKLQGEDLVFEVGYSHQVVFKKIPGITYLVEGTNKIIVRGIDKQLVGQTAYKIKKIRKPDPYKGKGIRFAGEHIKLKPGKKAKTVGATK